MSVRETGRWTGAPEGPAALACEPRFGWRELFVVPGDPGASDLDAEGRLIQTISVCHGVSVERAGRRSQSYDLDIVDRSPADRLFARAVGLEPGKYEVKALWRRGVGRSFDSRFKMGRRGEPVYYRRDLAIKSFASALEDQLDGLIEHSVEYPVGAPRAGEVTSFVEEVHAFVDQAMQRRHSKSFARRLERLARVSERIPMLLATARRVQRESVQAADIVNSFADIEGIFIVAGHRYTMVTRGEIPGFIAFDSVSSEGLKLRYTQPIPSDKKSRQEQGKDREHGV